MAEINPPAFMQNRTDHTAEITRMALMGLLAGTSSTSSLVPRGGVHSSLGGTLGVTQTGTPSMAVVVASGLVAIPGSEGGKQGAYFALNDADKTVSLDTSHGSLNRIDIIVAKVQDAFYSGVTNAWALDKVTGTASSSPVAPTAPANSITLARVAVNAGVTSVSNANITDVRPYLAINGGVMKCTSTSRPASPPILQMIWETDTLRLYIWNGTLWRRVLDDSMGKGLIYAKHKTNGNLVTGISTEFTCFSKTVTTLEPSRVYRIEAFVPQYNEGTGGWGAIIGRTRIKDGTTTISESEFYQLPDHLFPMVVYVSGLYTTGGAQTSVTLNVTVERTSGSSLITVYGATNSPFELIVTDVTGNTALVEA